MGCLLPRWTAKWHARVEQDIEVEADTREEAEALIEGQMEPRNVVELLDFEIEDLEEVAVDA